MVYDGRPSTGCHTCQTRRIKCDKTRPKCNRCLFSRRECLGYANEHDLFFRDETHVTQLRVKRSENRKKPLEIRGLAAESSVSSGDSPPSNSTALTTKSDSLAPSTFFSQTPIEMVAIKGFMEGFVLSPRLAECSTGHLRYLPSLYAGTSTDSALSYSLNAMCIAALSLFSEHHERLRQLAWRMYGTALAKLNIALQDPIKARQNETLMAIVLFGSTESVLATSATRASASRHSHIAGATALLKLRSKDLVDDEVASTLFFCVRTHMILDRGQRSESVEPFFRSDISGWQHKLAGDPNNVNYTLSQYTILVPTLRSRAVALFQKSRNPTSTAAVEDLLNECKLFDAVLSTWPATIPEQWQYTTIAGQQDSSANVSSEFRNLFSEEIDIYHDGWIAGVWNGYRCARMFVAAIIMRCVGYLSPPKSAILEEPDYVLARGNLQQMADQICSSVPFFLGYKSPPAKNGMEKDAAEIELKTVEPVALAGYFLLWPLFVARSALTIPNKQRTWLRGRMVAINQYFGTAQALTLVEIGDKDEKRPLFAEHWDADMFENIVEGSNLYATGGM